MEPVVSSGRVDQVITQIIDQVKSRNRERQAEMRSASTVALALRNRAIPYFESWANGICEPLTEAGFSVNWVIQSGGPGERQNWYLRGTDRSAKGAGHRVNFDEPRFFVAISINPEDRTLFPQFVFIISLHHVRRRLTGIMAATAFGEIHYSIEADIDESLDIEEPQQWYEFYFGKDEIDPFTFTWQDDVEFVAPRFLEWVEEQMETALLHWSSYISQ